MKTVTSFPENFDLKSVTNQNTIESLDFFEEYVDFAINSTLTKQMPNLSEDDERKWAGVLLTNYLNGGTKAFTSSFGIRNKIDECGQNIVVELLIKAAIEKNAFEKSVMRKLIPGNELEFICEDITKRMFTGNYQETINLVKTNPVYQKNLIDNYVGLKYRSTIKPEIARARENVGFVKMALDDLEHGMRNSGQSDYGTYSGARK